MVQSTVRARGGSIKFVELFEFFGAKYDENRMPSIDVLESHGFCVTMGGTVLTVAGYEAICVLLGGGAA